ncbi:alpha/beta fold hydrolase [Magnetovibrio sp. PR-2]|uniref:alpha/beta hydrolase n=1 Tax=Magnetovibrio sp. PR-2 TaxID=3120356 RepID=UPI002FCE5695
MTSFLIAIVVAYVAIAAYMYFAQRSMMYFPNEPRSRIADTLVPEMKEVFFTTEDGLDLFAWLKEPSDPTKPTIVVYHGNAGAIGDRDHKARRFLDAGYGVMLAEYRRYSENPGELSEQGIYADARAAIEYLKAQGLSNSQIVVYGESLGTGVATKMAAEFENKGGPLAGVVLEAPFTSTVDVAQARYPFLPVSVLMKDRYESIVRIGSISAPLFIAHGELDAVIRFKFAQRLFEAANEPKRGFWVPEAGHDDLYEFGAGEAMIEFLDEMAVRN